MMFQEKIQWKDPVGPRSARAFQLEFAILWGGTKAVTD